MRLTTDLWIAALMRRVFGEGGFAAVMRRGASEAGAAFIVIRDREGRATLYGPAPQTSYDSGRPEDRQFSQLAAGVEMDHVETRLQKEARFDPDFWVVELEPGKTGVEELLSISEP